MHVVLREYREQQDLEPLFQYMNSDETQKWFSHKFQLNSLDQFRGWLRERIQYSYHDFFILENDQEIPIGFTYAYDYFSYDLHCKFTLCLFPLYEGYGYGPLAAIQMLDHLFSVYPLRQIFISVFDYNQNSLACNRKAGFVEVGKLPDYRFWKGRFYSLHYLVMQREAFYTRYTKYLYRMHKNRKEREEPKNSIRHQESDKNSNPATGGRK